MGKQRLKTDTGQLNHVLSIDNFIPYQFTNWVQELSMRARKNRNSHLGVWITGSMPIPYDVCSKNTSGARLYR